MPNWLLPVPLEMAVKSADWLVKLLNTKLPRSQLKPAVKAVLNVRAEPDVVGQAAA